jgi:hypothetical protein
VLGFDLVLSPDGVQEDWNAIYARLEQSAYNLATRQCSLPGRALLCTSKLFSRLWYKLRLSSPSSQMLTKFDNLG